MVEPVEKGPIVGRGDGVFLRFFVMLAASRK